MRRDMLCALLLLTVGVPAMAQDDMGFEGPMGHPEFVARWNQFGGTGMRVTGDYQCWAIDCRYRTWDDTTGRAFYDYLAAGPVLNVRNAHRFQVRSPDGQPVAGARFVLGLPRQRKLMELDQRSDEDGMLGIRLHKPRKEHDVFILAEGYSPVLYTMSGGKLESADHVIELQPATEQTAELVEFHYQPGPR